MLDAQLNEGRKEGITKETDNETTNTKRRKRFKGGTERNKNFSSSFPLFYIDGKIFTEFVKGKVKVR